MGSASSKFKKYLQHGDEFAAMQVFQSSPELRKNLDPNTSYGESHHHNTALHYAARHGMKHLLRTFLNDLGGNPNKRNASNETGLHCACLLGPGPKSPGARERRAACLQLLLQWRGSTVGQDGSREKADLAAQDIKGNTALHCAAIGGLKRCVELLVSHGAPLFAENLEKLTPCDLAVRSTHLDIAAFLESRMVFTEPSDTVNELELIGSSPPGGDGSDSDEVYSGLRTQDLQEAKDQLLVETSDMLHIPLFTAEALLRDNEWSREALLEKWIKDPVQCCQLAGVQPPTSALQQKDGITLEYQNDNVSSANSTPAPESPEELICDICTLSVAAWDRAAVVMSCQHRYCANCWETYLTVKIQEGEAHHILCPAYSCDILVPAELIEALVAPDVARRYLHFDIKAFVERNKSIKWCPLPGCGRAVRFPESEHPPQSPPPSLTRPVQLTSHAVDCGNGHFFCWECLGEAHAPCGCSDWLAWQTKISSVHPEDLRASCLHTEHAANCLWLVTNSKPCPNCKSPIQKNEGCNHIKCSKCKFDFCWVCLENWKRHSSATGGYFRCNRFEAVNKADEKQGILISEALIKNQQMQELNRFLHYYTRFRNHENSQHLEEPLLDNVRQKMDLLASSLGSEDTSDKATTQFVEDGVRELLKARRILCGSYVYGYYLEDNGYNKAVFEFLQNELEEVTEKLSEMVARPYLRTPRAVIMQVTSRARRKRHEFVRAVAKGLAPPESPTSPIRHRQRRFPLGTSQEDLDPNNPWVKDAQGRHTNLSALYDWPDYESDDEESEVGRALAVSLVGECAHQGCRRPRARNPRTGAIHEFCSLRCSRADRDDVFRVNVTSDYNMDLVIALEMSRLQMIEDAMKQQRTAPEESTATQTPQTRRQSQTTQTAGPSGVDSGQDENQLKVAIQLSLEETSKLSPPREESECLQIGVGRFKTPADITVDYFLKSLAGRPIELKPLDSEPPPSLPVVEVQEDGRFRIGDLHDGAWCASGSYSNGGLRRAHSTGDLKVADEPPRYHLDSDHSSQHEDKPEELAGRALARAGRHLLLLQSSTVEEADVQSSLDGSDSLTADLEVCGILEPTPPTASVATPSPTTSTDPVVSGPSSAPVTNTGPSLRIQLETDSSNEYESETGIPRSPTLFISGVSINRTPEPRSPAAGGDHGNNNTNSDEPVTPPAVSINSATSTNASPSVNVSPTQTSPKAKSASEPEREREMFRFPKSCTDGALSSVLHVQESNLSSDDFHEALFLPERSPKGGGRRRRKSRKKDKEKEKDKDSSAEASSAL